MTFNELDKKFDNITRKLTNDIGEVMVKIGNSAVVKIRERIIGTGNNAEGNKFPPYSQKSMLSGCKNFIQQGSCVTQLKKKDTKWVTIQRGGKNYHLFEIPGGYKQFRELNHRQSAFVDFSFSGRMWANIKLVSNNSEHNQGIARISATTEEDKAKLAGNTKRKGDILKLSKDEISLLSEIYSTNIVQIFHNEGL